MVCVVLTFMVRTEPFFKGFYKDGEKADFIDFIVSKLEHIVKSL